MTRNLLLVLFVAISFLPLRSLAQSPVAGLGASVNVGCSPLSVSFDNQSTGAASYSWDFGNGAISTVENPTVVYLAPGSYTVSLIATSTTGSTDTIVMSNYIEVLADPIANYSLSQTGSCATNNLVSFSNTSANASDYLWDFGDGGSSTLASPTHTYTEAGTYTVTLIASNSVGCSDVNQMVNIITIDPSPEVEFSVDQNFSCDSNYAYQFEDLTPGAVTSIWDFGDGASSILSNPSHTYGASGIFDVSLISTNSSGCMDTLSKIGFVENFGSSSVSFYWEELNSGNGDSIICLGDEIQFFPDSNIQAISFLWDFGNGITDTANNPVVQYNTVGSYDINLQIINYQGCAANRTIPNSVFVAELPNPEIVPSMDTVCAGTVVHFTNNSSNTTGHWWVFNAGSPGLSVSPLAEPDRAYPNVGVRLTEYYAVSEYGCKNQITIPITVLEHITDFTVDESTGCAPFETSFTKNDSNAVAWEWDFGDGNTSNIPNPLHTYQFSGEFDVSLVSTGSNGCKDTAKINSFVTVTADTVSIFLSDTISGCTPYPVDFSNNIIGSNSWHWDFGDGTTSNLPNPTHTYTEGGNYTVSLTTESSGGCYMFVENYSTLFLEEFNAGFAAYAPDCEDMLVVLVDTSTQSTAVSWFWNFGDGTGTEWPGDSIVMHQYFDTISYNVSLTVTSASGCVSTLMVNNYVDFENCTIMGGAMIDQLDNPPMDGSGFTPTDSLEIEPPICAPVTVYFISPFMDATSWEWDLGDGTFSTDEHVYHYYSEAGIYDVKMIAQSPSGPDTLILNDYVDIAGPKADFTATVDYDCLNNSVQFNDLSVDADDYLWNFGDGTTSTIESPTHQYPTSNLIFPVTLRVADTNGCYSQYGSVLSVQTYDPVVDFEDTICFGQEILFSPEDTINYTYTWDFGDGTTSNLQFTSHQYSAPGVYEVTFEATHAFGCTQTYTLDSVYVIGFAQDFTITDSVLGCVSDTLVFTPDIVNGTSYKWIFSGSGISFISATSSSSTIPEVVFQNSGLFTVELITEIGQCVDTVRKDDIIEIFDVSSNFLIQQLDYCDPYLVQLTSVSTNAAAHNWLYLGTSGPDSSVVEVYLPADSTEIALEVSNQFGCVDEHSGVFVPDQLSVNFSSSDTEGCTPHSIDFTNESENAASFYWDFGDGTTSVLENPTHTYTSAGSFDVMLVVQPSSGNCSDTIFFPNYVLTSSPEADFSIIENYSCAPMIVEFVDSSSDALTWNWDFGDGSSSSLQNPLHVYNTPGSYSIGLTVTDVNGCQSTKFDSNAVFVPGPIADFSASQTAFCDSGQVQFTDLSTDAVSWSWTFGDGNASNLQNPTHNFVGNGAFTVALIVEDSAGCSTSLIMDTLVHIYETPNAQFIVNDSIGCMPLDVTLTDYSAGADSWFWDMGDGVQYSSIPSLHTYSNQGTYQVNLVASVSGMCYDTAFKDVQVLDFADATVNPVADLCQQNPIITLSPVQTGGVWSGSGITSASMGTFDPNVAGAGTHTIFYTMPGTCAASDSVQITVLPNLDAEIDSIDEVCLSQGQLTIPVTNLGGVWSGIGIIDSTTGLFDPSVSGTGNFMLAYTTSNGICTDTDSVEVTVLMDADPTITPVSDFCEQAASMNLVSNQSGGVWSGPGIVSSATGEFSSSLAGPGTHTISYEIAGACGNMDTVQITVHEFIEAAITPVTDLCAGQASFDLNSSNSGGTWSGVGITDSLAGTFDPGVSGIGSFVVFYTTTNGTCSDEDSTQVQVLTDADASFTTLGTVCENSAPQSMIPTVSGGVWSGAGIVSSSSGLFNPNVSGVGVHQITYSFSGTCGDTVSHPVEVAPTPDISFTSNVTDGCTELDVLFTSSSSVPGTYFWEFGNGMTSELENPQITFGPGQFSAQLTVTSSNGCTNTLLMSNMIFVTDSIPNEPVIRRVSVVSDTSVVLDWEESTDPAFSGYKIYRKNLTTGLFEELQLIELSGTTTFLDVGLNTLDNVYCYKITELDRCGNEMEVLEATDHCSINISAEASGTHYANVTWTPYEGCGIASYELFRYQEKDTTATYIASIPATGLSYTDSTLYCQMNYTYRLFAKDICGNPIASWSDSASASSKGISEQQISNVIRATVIDDESIWVEWTIPEVGSDFIDYYQIYRSKNGTDFIPIGTVPDGVNGLSDESVDVFNERYFYKIQVVNGCQENNVMGVEGTSILLKSTKISENQGSLEWTPYQGWKEGVDYYEIQVLNEFNQWETVKIVKGSILQTIVRF